MVAIYPTRQWKNVDSNIIVKDEKTQVNVVEMDETEFREFVLWRLGLGAGKEQHAIDTAQIPELQPTQLRSRVGQPSSTPQLRAQKVREYDHRRVK